MKPVQLAFPFERTRRPLGVREIVERIARERAELTRLAHSKTPREKAGK
jgi:hypothetical protein